MERDQIAWYQAEVDRLRKLCMGVVYMYSALLLGVVGIAAFALARPR